MILFRRIVLSFFGMLLILLIGTAGFAYTEKIDFFDALWLTVISVLTIGYGDLVPRTFAGKVFTLIIIPIGIGVVSYALGVFVASVVEGKLSKTMEKRKMERKIKRLENHIIVCGIGRVGQQVSAQLASEGISVVVVDRDVTMLEKMAKGFLHIEGDATDDYTLHQAGIERAAGLVATLPEDADNVFISLTAKGMNPTIHIVARAEKYESEEKLLRAGADKVINPSSIGGRRMAMSIIKPVSVDFVDTILHSHEEDYGVEEIVFQDSSVLAHKMLKEARVREEYGVTIVAIKRGAMIISNPGPEETLEPGDVVIVFGTKKQMVHFEKASR
ncbi:potassium channel family protein [Aneurinibacillus tyrosinisolvens]|uniref:potassium channel family protein n=1 Tax=Aneurinibacillus tyrosinisolvens TaxID=1443435 RepID=UPI00063FBECB|nr:potassium channel protein [Aneurinibacillus tyrosinisolvens]